MNSVTRIKVNTPKLRITARLGTILSINFYRHGRQPDYPTGGGLRSRAVSTVPKSVTDDDMSGISFALLFCLSLNRSIYSNHLLNNLRPDRPVRTDQFLLYIVLLSVVRQSYPADFFAVGRTPLQRISDK